MDAAPTDTEKFFLRHRPDPRLVGLVHAITAYREGGDAMRDAVETASLVVPLVLSFGGPFSIALDRRPAAGDDWLSFVAGLHPGHVRMDSQGDAVCLQIDFTPIGARLFFGLPMSDLTSRMVSLEAFGDRAVGELHARLAGTSGWPERIGLAEDFIISRVARATRAFTPATLHAYREIVGRRGNLRIDALTAGIGWSRKRIAAEFREQIGLPPKALARIVRFSHASRLATSGRAGGWADVAAACGYADQAHLTRDFVAFAGVTPRRWLADIGPRQTETILQEADRFDV